ncbi:MAG TPA: protein-glutamate O-methyltransferase CheR [Bacteroidota bacterium]|nr:protein-glutamate O-methyltransferase CheR [Bacteroidota bacterium]
MTIPTIVVPAIPRPAGSTGVKMTDEEFRQLREFIYQQCGIFFPDNKKYLLEGRLGKRLQVMNLANFEAYLQLLKYGTRRQEEMRFFFEAITINETFFFRNEPQFEAFEQTLVPSVLEARGSTGGKLRIWSAASSSGEEAYTLAMLFLERIKPRHPALEIEIVGTDINQAVIETARKGVYRDYSIRNMPKYYLEKYFAAEDSRYYLRDEVKRIVRFENMNLYDRGRMRMMSNFDIIFCCNVLIYFDSQSKIQVVSNLYDSLRRGGYLFIGYAESLHGISTAFKLINFAKTVAYKKE